MSDAAQLPAPEPVRVGKRSVLSQGILVVVALTIAIFAAHWFYSPRPIRINHIRTMVVPAGHLVVTTSFHLENQRGTTITINDILLTLTSADGTEITVSQVGRDEMEGLERSNPALGVLLVNPMFRNSQVGPGKSVEGMAVFEIEQPAALWAARRAARVRINFDHRESEIARIY